jgi:hypothetical protein
MDEPRSWSAAFSRRVLLQGAAGAAGTAIILGVSTSSAPAAPKLSRQVVAYQDHPDGDKRCNKCAQFQPPNACKIVEGPISPDGYCKFFVPSTGRDLQLGSENCCTQTSSAATAVMFALKRSLFVE